MNCRTQLGDFYTLTYIYKRKGAQVAVIWISVLALTVSVISTIISYSMLRKGGSVVKIFLHISNKEIVMDIVNPGRGSVQILKIGICEHPSNPILPRTIRKAGLARAPLCEVPSKLDLPVTLRSEATTGSLLDIKEQEEIFRACINGFYLTSERFLQMEYERFICSPPKITPKAALIRAFVLLGNGKTIYSPWWKPVALTEGNAYSPSTKTLIKGYVNRLRYRAGPYLR